MCHLFQYNGWTALHWAAYCGHSEIVTLLINNGCDVNIKTTDKVSYILCRIWDSLCYILQYGYTALHHAAIKGHLEIVALLINDGCDVNATSDVSHI